MEERYNTWQDKFTNIKEKRLSVIDDMLIDLDVFLEKKDYKNYGFRVAKTELEIYKVRQAANHLLDEIKDITLSEEKYRSIVIKLKTKYRELNKKFNDNKDSFEEYADDVSMQLENIEAKFLDFERVMEKNQYNEVIHIVRALDTMVSHMSIIIEELPNVILMAKHVLPSRINEVKANYDELVNDGYSIDYLNLDYNIEEANKNINNILDKARILNIENSMFDLKTMLSYYDSLFVDFEKERLSRKVYEDELAGFDKRINRINTQVNSVVDSLEMIENTYNLTDEDRNTIEEANKSLVVINDDYNKLLKKDESKAMPYSMLNEELDALSNRLTRMDETFTKTLKSLGNMYDDEERAREQLKEIEEFMKQAKKTIHSYKLPVITDTYFIQLDEANDAIREIVNELRKKPIEISVLNTRVDTARDLVLKLYNTTNEMIKTARMAEISIVYGNRYRSHFKEIDRGLEKAEDSFYKGNYKSSLDISIKSIQLVDKDIYQKLLKVYDK